jgi:hypothetical protein
VLYPFELRGQTKAYFLILSLACVDSVSRDFGARLKCQVALSN